MESADCAPANGSPKTFLLLVLVLSVPFYLLGALGSRLPGLTILPASALMAAVPMIAALVLIGRRDGRSGGVALLRRAIDFRKSGNAGWFVVALVFMPAVCVLEFLLLQVTGTGPPLPQIAIGEALFFFMVFFIGAIGEELGWQGYLYPALRAGRSALGAALVVGVLWALWHVVPFAQLGRGLDWILWHSLSAVALRVIIVWLFENTAGGVLVAVLFHTMINVSWALFPNAGSYYDPFVTFLILAVAVGLIVLLWCPTTLTRFRHGDRLTTNTGAAPGPTPETADERPARRPARDVAPHHSAKESPHGCPRS